MFYLLDTYLNTPDKFLNETPLHFASKFGSLDILELFLAFPECDRERKNTRGETPADVIIIFYSILHALSKFPTCRMIDLISLDCLFIL